MHTPLDLPTVQSIGQYSTQPCIQACATAWLSAYHLARHLAFTEAVALCQANAAWDDTAGWWRRADEEEPSYEVTESGRQALAIGR
jgi:cation diffusion facilitator CzcD-associated flavoprotein CzcO